MLFMLISKLYTNIHKVYFSTCHICSVYIKSNFKGFPRFKWSSMIFGTFLNCFEFSWIFSRYLVRKTFEFFFYQKPLKSTWIFATVRTAVIGEVLQKMTDFVTKKWVCDKGKTKSRNYCKKHITSSHKRQRDNKLWKFYYRWFLYEASLFFDVDWNNFHQVNARISWVSTYNVLLI